MDLPLVTQGILEVETKSQCRKRLMKHISLAEKISTRELIDKMSKMTNPLPSTPSRAIRYLRRASHTNSLNALDLAMGPNGDAVSWPRSALMAKKAAHQAGESQKAEVEAARKKSFV